MAQAERQHPGDEDSEAEERAFKLNMAAVVSMAAKPKRFAAVSNHRFRPAAGGSATVDMQVHKHALQVCKGAG